MATRYRPETVRVARVRELGPQEHGADPRETWGSTVLPSPFGSSATTRKEFTEPVALSSTQPADLPLPRRALRLSFGLVALRAPCTNDAM